MDGKFETWEKWLELVSLSLIFLSSIYKGICCAGDIGIVIMLSFVAILLFVIISIVALFPATWRMTDKEKEKIKDLERYQKSYTRVFVVINMLLSIFMVLLIFKIP